LDLTLTVLVDQPAKVSARARGFGSKPSDCPNRASVNERERSLISRHIGTNVIRLDGYQLFDHLQPAINHEHIGDLDPFAVGTSSQREIAGPNSENDVVEQILAELCEDDPIGIIATCLSTD
jgi:hypothetical protein